MPRLNTNKKLVVEVMTKILTDPKTSVNQKISAAKVLASLNQKPAIKSKKEKEKKVSPLF